MHIIQKLTMKTHKNRKTFDTDFIKNRKSAELRCKTKNSHYNLLWLLNTNELLNHHPKTQSCFLQQNPHIKQFLHNYHTTEENLSKSNQIIVLLKESKRSFLYVHNINLTVKIDEHKKYFANLFFFLFWLLNWRKNVFEMKEN